jgi:hypothetical protein
MFHRVRAKKQGRGVAPRPCSTTYFFGLPDPGKYCRARNFATIADSELRLMPPAEAPGVADIVTVAFPDAPGLTWIEAGLTE